VLVSALGVMAAVAAPAFTRYQSKSKTTEAAEELRRIYAAQAAFFAEKKRYCRTFKECGYEPTLRTYSIVLGSREVATPESRDDKNRHLVINEAVEAAAQAGVHPRVEKKKFLAAAVANLDGDVDHDVWTIDETGQLNHVASDFE